MFSCVETEAGVVVVVGVGSGDVDNVDVWVGGELGVGAVGACCGGCADGFEELGGAGCGCGGGGCCDDVADIGCIAGLGIDEEVFCKCWSGVRKGRLKKIVGFYLLLCLPSLKSVSLLSSCVIRLCCAYPRYPTSA